MQFLTIILSIMLLALTAPTVLASPFSVQESIPEGYTLGQMGFHGEIAGHEITYNGTIEEVVAYAETLYPGITKSLAARDDVPLSNIPEIASTSIAGRSASNYRGGPDDKKGNRYCGQNNKDCPSCGNKKWGYAGKTHVEEGIKYLNKVTAACSAGGRKCVRISCSWHSAIFLCNDMEEVVEMPCNWTSTFAQDIIDDVACSYPKGDGSGWYLTQYSGQQFAQRAAYNVYLGQANC
ncbi:hypothetical protein VTL71DRAFT_501 [Oculimacula yallundae]|uniref:Uncharacterized protein n=1 Tax=Oculimacula yallundae TaxID=86028 RepID=A0ABR4D070_9HELO